MKIELSEAEMSLNQFIIDAIKKHSRELRVGELFRDIYPSIRYGYGNPLYHKMIVRLGHLVKAGVLLKSALKGNHCAYYYSIVEGW